MPGSGGFPASRFVTSSSRYSSAYRRPLIESAPQRFASRTFERSTFQRPPAYGSTRGSTRGRAPLRVSSRYDRERIPELREFAQPPSPPARQHLGSSSSATSEKGEMLRYKEEMKRREEEHKRREEELRLQRERERIKYEREKLAREKLEVQQMKLLASAQFSAQFMQQQPHSGIQPLLAPPAAHHHHQQQQQQIPKDSSQSSSRRDTSTSEKSRQKSGDKSRKSDAPKTNKRYFNGWMLYTE